MSTVHHVILLTRLMLCGLLVQATSPVKQEPRIIISKNATHISRITADSIYVISGSTYSFSVDTPEDKGLMSIHTTTDDLFRQISSTTGSKYSYSISTKTGELKTRGNLESGDALIATARNGKTKKYTIAVRPMAIGGRLEILEKEITINTKRTLTICFKAGQRSPDATVRILLPAEINVTPDNTLVNVIGRGNVTLRELPNQSIGRVGTKYPYTKVGNVTITKTPQGHTQLIFEHLDLRPDNGVDLKISISDVKFKTAGTYDFAASYTTSKPEVLSSAGVGLETTTLSVKRTVTDFERVLHTGLAYHEQHMAYNSVNFNWSSADQTSLPVLMQSVDGEEKWVKASVSFESGKSKASISGLLPNHFYTFRLHFHDGEHRGYSNTVYFYSGKMNVNNFGIYGNDQLDDTENINHAIDSIHRLGGGTLLFDEGTYIVRTIHLKSNVHLYLTKNATIKALKGGDAPEQTWFSDKKYRSGLSPTDTGPYDDPENYLTKQDVGHHYFHNAMFFAEAEDNIKIIGNGRITGDGNLVTGDKVMNNSPDNRSDKMFTFKLCSNIEIGGLYRDSDLWYDPDKDEPYYITKDLTKDFNTDNMLQIDRGGHFVLLATGTDNIHVHNTYFAKYNQSNARDIYDFMQCNNVTVFNIYSKVSSDDIVKPGSDCSLGFTRPASNYKIRNIIGDTNCNLFQIGSETADDIMDIHVDNIYVLGANKAGFSISTNDGGHIKDIHLNCGHTGTLHSRSKMLRTFTPFFISISNRARILGAEVGRYRFTDNGEQHDELLIKNVNIGKVENIILNGIDITEVYGGSSYGKAEERWKTYDGSQRRATPIIAGYGLPDPRTVVGGLDFTLPDGNHTGYVSKITFNDVHVLVKGGNAVSDTTRTPAELGVGQYNASNLKVQPSYGLWARHVKDLTIKNCSFSYEEQDGRYPIYLEDAIGAQLSDISVTRSANNHCIIKLKKSVDIVTEKIVYYYERWLNKPGNLPPASFTEMQQNTDVPKKM
jgi:polygalacturonase